MSVSPQGMLLPKISVESAPFWEGASAGELRIQACSRCKRLRFPPRPMCPWCQSTERHWQAMSGRGTIWSFIVAHPPLLPGYAELSPFNVITVALDDDPTIRVVGNLVSSGDGPINEIDPSTIEIGEAVSVVFAHLTDSITFPRWIRCNVS